MSKELYVNIPANDLKLAREFYTKIGFSVREEFSNDMALAVYLDNIYFMLVSEDFFKQMTKREISDTAKTAEVLNAIGLGSKQEVDEFVTAAKEAGAPWVEEPYQEEEFIYAGGFRDPFGHQFAVHYMDMS